MRISDWSSDVCSSDLLGVPTVWLAMFQYVDQNPSLDVKADILLERVVIGGSAAPRAMIERFDKQFSSYVIHAWGMTEMSPLGTTGNQIGRASCRDRVCQYV